MGSVVVDYTSKDYDGFRASLLDYARTAFPEWQPASVADFGVMMVELFSYVGDILSFYGDRAVNEAYLPTATQRASILAIAELLGYIPGSRTAAVGTVSLTNNTGNPVTVPRGTQFRTDFVSALDSPLLYESITEVTIADGATTAVSVAEGDTVSGTEFTVFGETVEVVQIGTVDGTAGQEYTIPDTPVIDSSLRVFADSIGVGGDDIQEYTRYPHIIDAAPTDKAYQYRKDDKGVVTVVLGDGTNGVLPPVGNRVWATYRVGGGTNGNVPANTITAFTGDSLGLVIASSSSMSGGQVEESNDEIRVNAPKAYRTQDRAVTLRDYADLALALPSVGKANAVANSFTSVTVYLLGEGGVQLSAGDRDVVRAYLQDRAMAGTTVTCSPATIVPVDIGAVSYEVAVTVDSRYVASQVKEYVRQALLAYINAPARNFGDRIALSDVFAVVMSVEGVLYCTVPSITRTGDPVADADLVFREWEIPAASNIYITTTGGI